MQWPLLPKFLDIYYHLGVMKGFADAGGYVTRAFWEYAPSGRPHLYPPLLHVLMLALYKAGVPAITIGRFVDCFSYPLFLFLFYRLTAKYCSERAAFFSLLLLASVFSVALSSVTLSAFNLSAILGLWMFCFLQERKSLGAGLCLALCFYTHTLMAGLMLLTLVFYALLRREVARTAFRTAAGALLLAAPFLVYQFHFRDYFTFVKVHEFRLWEFDASILLLALCGMVYLTKKRSLKKAALPLAFLAGFAPLILSHPPRYFSGHGLIGPAMLAGVFADEFFSQWTHKPFSRKWLACFVAFVLFILLAAPFFKWNVKEGKGEWVWADRTVTRYLLPDEKRSFRAQGFSIYFQEDYAKIVQAVREHSGPEDILWTDFSYTAGILGILADRATSCAMLAEVKSYESSNRLKDARVIVWFKDKEAKPTSEMRDAVERYHFSLLQETDMAFVWLNPEGYGQRRVPKPTVPMPVLFGLGTVVAFGLAFSHCNKKAPL